MQYVSAMVRHQTNSLVSNSHVQILQPTFVTQTELKLTASEFKTLIVTTSICNNEKAGEVVHFIISSTLKSPCRFDHFDWKKKNEAALTFSNKKPNI